jgi:hypothetical protein
MSLSPEELPPVLTVPEAAVVLRISRSAAFRQAELFRLTEGREGIPNYQLGRVVRVPRDQLLRRFGLTDG